MAAKGTVAKEQITKTIKSAFGEDFIGEFDKKIYLWANDGGERVQIAISLTCPKNPIEVDTRVADTSGDWDFSDDPKVSPIAVAAAEPAEITETEKQNLADLMAKLGL